jgi:D-beta-D-heptose 7-phosphate kinase/D-beta-D-heptose 1-phosphate adenosyltransferase
MSQLAALVNQLGAPRVLIVGDLILDRYVEGNAVKVSPEAPVLVFESLSQSFRLGGAANVAANIVSLGGKAAVLGVVGEDAGAEQLRDMMSEQGIETGLVLTDPTRPTIRKTRYVSKTHQVLRVDEEKRDNICGQALEQARALVAEQLPGFQGVILSDYAKGMLARELIQAVVATARGHKIPVLVDPKGADYARYQGVTLVTPNREEAEQATGMKIRKDQDLDAAAEKLMQLGNLDAAVITLGKDGIYFRNRAGERRHLPTEARSVFDVTGAGDTVVAVLGYCLAEKLPLVEAIRLANAAAGIVVGRFGTAAVTRQEILALEGAAGHGKVLDRADLARVVARLRGDGRRIVFTNGCFDLLHPGHVDYLRQSRSYGDVLMVGINTDASIQRLQGKGKGRPICPLVDRMEMVAALDSVDFVVPFEEDTPEALIQEASPQVLVKGEDWKDKGVVGRDWVESHGGRVVLVPLKTGYSTTALIQRILDRSRT